jgi:hydroxyacylglutathione hydrolase
MVDEFHTIEKIAPDTYRIDEKGIANAYLLVGEKRALLIDSGDGVGNIREAVESLTSLPIDVVLTHRHCDHAGGINWFKTYYFHKKDNHFIYALEASKWAAKKLAKMGGNSVCLSKKPYHAKKILIDDTKVFDLGGRLIRVMNTPGHTPGSIVLMDEKNKLLFSGDEVNYWLWLQLPGCTSVKTWLPNAKKILSLADSYSIYCGHNNGLLQKKQIEELIQRGEELLSGAKFSKISRGVYTYPDNDWKNHAVIWFSKIK